jgi:protein-S-isoprenylcysteine O-methyltransferase Ste14
MFVRVGKFFFKYRNILFPVIYLCLFVFTRPGLFWGNPKFEPYVCALGIVIALLGQLFRIMVIGFAYIRRGGKDGKVYADSLVQTGFYAHVRHPMYVGNYLIMLGFVLLYGSLWAYLLVLPFFTVVYYSLVKNEENFLQGQFGQEYDEYAAKVNRFIPNFKGIKASLKDYRYDWKKVVRKEYGTITFVLCGVIAMLIWKNIILFGYADRQRTILMLSACLIPVAIFYGTIRYLKKKTNYLKSG